MAKIERFEDLMCWQKARELNRAIYSASKNSSFSKDFALRDQIRRATVSVMSNIAEGFERGGDREFIQFLSQAKGSCGEVRSQLYAALDENHLSRDKFDELSQLSTQTSRLIAGLMAYLSRSEMRGNKFKEVSNAC